MSSPRWDEENTPVPSSPHSPDRSSEKEHLGPASHHEARLSQSNSVTSRRKSVSAKLQNPLEGLSKNQIYADVEAFCHEKGLGEHVDSFRKGALVAQVQHQPNAFEKIDELTEEDKESLRFEVTHRWHQPFQLYFLVILCAGSAVVQGMDQTAVNGAQQYYFAEFGITNEWHQGLLNGAPYLCSAAIGCWTNAPLNYYFGRRGTIFISCLVSFLTGIWMAVADTWYNLLIARFALGLAVGAKSSTTPVYAAECAPKTIRGALTMMWQMWTAFGIMLGFIASVAFQNVVTQAIPGLNWRLMLGSTSIPPLIILCQVYLCPESPRWYMEKGKYDKAWDSFTRLRKSELKAARDYYYAYCSIQVENEQREGKNLFKEIFTVPRNRRAWQSSTFVMFMQQFCGVNVIAYYSTSIFLTFGFSESQALLVSMGTGVVNWLFAIPAVLTIDTFGRRNLLLFTYPFLALFLFITGFSFWIPAGTGQLATVATGIYLFMAFYSPGMGPVPFTYSAEAYPLYVRDIGMSFATATTWGFNFIISLTFPALLRSFKPQGAFGWYAGWNCFAMVIVYFFFQETKGLTLEELDMVFGVKTRDHAVYYLQKLPWYFKKRVLFRDLEPFPPLYNLTGDPHFEGYSENQAAPNTST